VTNVDKVSVRKPEAKRPIGGCRCSCEDTIKMHLRGKGRVLE
jgi:hypothetical protein